MTVEDEVLAAAEGRTRALVAADPDALAALLHPGFRWTSHRGERFDRAEYVRRNTGGELRWQSQHLQDAAVVVAGDTAVLCAIAVDIIGTATSSAARRTSPVSYRMPITQTWTLVDGRWLCLAGHAGPAQP